MMRQMRKPMMEPNQTWGCQGMGIRGDWREGRGRDRWGLLAHLADEFFVDGDIAVGPVEGLAEEGEEDGDDDCGLEGLAEDDEEDGDGEDVDGHCFEGCRCAGSGSGAHGRGGERGEGR
jgi:hypothetical protein